MGVVKGDTRSLHYGSSESQWVASQSLGFRV